jgi:uncharacterized protein involved in exopolysaccharide biosynthesis
MEAASRERMANGARGAESPDVAASSLIQNLEVMLAGAEARLAELAQRLGNAHPQQRSAQAEVNKLRGALAAQVRSASNSVGNNADILREREQAVRAALAAQKAHVLELNRSRDELGVLVKDVESAQHAFDATSQRFSQTRIEGLSEQSDVAVLNPANAPASPAGPRVALNTMLSVFLGGMLGLGFALLFEMIDRRVRSPGDLSEVLHIPMFGAIDWNAPARRSNPIGKLLQRHLRLS